MDAYQYYSEILRVRNDNMHPDWPGWPKLMQQVGPVPVWVFSAKPLPDDLAAFVAALAECSTGSVQDTWANLRGFMANNKDDFVLAMREMENLLPNFEQDYGPAVNELMYYCAVFPRKQDRSAAQSLAGALQGTVPSAQLAAAVYGALLGWRLGT